MLLTFVVRDTDFKQQKLIAQHQKQQKKRHEAQRICMQKVFTEEKVKQTDNINFCFSRGKQISK